MSGIALLLAAPQSISQVSPAIVATGAIVGFLLCIAYSGEMSAVKHGMTGNVRKDVILRNFVNNFTELDTVVVLAASVLIGSYTYNGIFGGTLIVIGVLVLGLIE